MLELDSEDVVVVEDVVSVDEDELPELEVLEEVEVLDELEELESMIVTPNAPATSITTIAANIKEVLEALRNLKGSRTGEVKRFSINTFVRMVLPLRGAT